MIFNVYYYEDKIGELVLEKTGLYWKITCRIDIQMPGFHRLAVRTEKGTIDLGTCVYYAGQLGMDKQISISEMGMNPERFWIKKEEKRINKKRIYISDAEPFDHLKEILTAKYRKEDGQPALIWDS